MRSGSIVRYWVTLFKSSTSHAVPQPDLTLNMVREVVAAARKILEVLKGDGECIVHMCIVLGVLATTREEVADEAAIALADVMDHEPVSHVEACLRSLLSVYRKYGLVLGIPSQQAVGQANQDAMREKVTHALAEHGENDTLRDLSARFFARSQDLSAVLQVAGESDSSFKSALREIYTGLRHYMSWSWSEGDMKLSEGDREDKAKAKQLLLKIEHQARSCRHDVQLSQGLRTLVSWVQEEQGAYQPERRFQLLAILFGVEESVAAALFSAFDYGIQVGRFDEEHINSLFRALIELEFLDLVPQPLARQIIDRINQDAVVLHKKFSISASLGVLGSLVRHQDDPFFVDLVVKIIIETGSWWHKKGHDHSAYGIVYEALWALCVLPQEKLLEILQKWTSCADFASGVRNDRYLQEWDEGGGYENSDAIRALRLAERIVERLDIGAACATAATDESSTETGGEASREEA
eukprot:TRINITY_DN18642_c0_g3_i1.p1 TRINITY_DN18642_c0_g3~~TRINITY_DN18642_c0_g3_i1.p1  ORF type:complete len:486 (+),score=93.46 TRINITY_DN18642_c0_g3_i1:60-1460(+)